MFQPLARVYHISLVLKPSILIYELPMSLPYYTPQFMCMKPPWFSPFD